MTKEKDVNWLRMCEAASTIMAKCSKAQYFAYLIDSTGRVRGTGYNGTPSGMQNCTDGGCPRAVNNPPSGTAYNSGEGLCYANHAEINAIIGVDRAILRDSTIVVNGVCCFGCAKEIAGAGIKRVVGMMPKNSTANNPRMPLDYEETKKLFVLAGIEWILY